MRKTHHTRRVVVAAIGLCGILMAAPFVWILALVRYPGRAACLPEDIFAVIRCFEDGVPPSVVAVGCVLVAIVTVSTIAILRRIALAGEKTPATRAGELGRQTASADSRPHS